MSSTNNLFFSILFALSSICISSQSLSTKAIDDLISNSSKLSNTEEELKSNLKIVELSKKQNYPLGELQALITIFKIHLNAGKHKEALDTATQIEKTATETDNKFYASLAHTGKCLTYSYMGFYNKAEESNINAKKEALKLPKNDLYYIAMGQVFSSKAELINLQYGPTDKKIKNDLESIKNFGKIKNKTERNSYLSMIYTSIGYTYLESGDIKSSNYYNREALKLAIEEKDLNNQAFALYGLAGDYLSLKKYDSAIYYYKKALPIFKKYDDLYRIQYIYEDLATAYEEKNDIKNYRYFSKASSDALEIIKKIEKKETEKIANNILQEKDDEWFKHKTIFYTIIAILLFFLVLIILSYIKKHKQEKELEEKNKDILIKKNIELSILETKISNASALVIELAKKNDPAFLIKFQELYSDFHCNLTTKYPDMTTGQIKFCALLKLNFSTKEIAYYQNLSVRSVEMKKNRLRKQLNISSETDLNTWMNNLQNTEK